MYLYQSLFVPVYAYAARCSCAALAGRPTLRPGFTGLLPCDWKSRDRRCSNGGSDLWTLLMSDVVEYRSTVLWVIRLTKTVSRSAVLFATLWHCRELSGKRYAHRLQFEFWLLWQLTPAVTDRLLPVLRCQQSVPSVPSTTPCANVPTACC